MLAVDIADEMVADLNDNFAPTSGTSFVAERKWLPEYEAAKLDRVTIVIVPRGFEAANVSRSMENEIIHVDVAVMRRVDVINLEEGDLVASLAEDVRLYITGKTYAGARRVGTQVQGYSNPQLLREHNVFMTLTTFTFRTLR